MRKANTNNQLLTSSSWDTICFPVQSVPVNSVLDDSFRMIPNDRQRLIVGDMPDDKWHIFAVQSPGYSLVPNAIIRDAVAEVAGAEQPVHIRYSRNGEFIINVLLPDQITVSPNDVIQRQLTFTNSYTGKSQFTIQGTEMKRVREQKVRVAYYRQICSNGMMGWADEFVSLEQYLDWLATGTTPEKVNVKGLEWAYTETDVTQDLRRIFTHRGINLELFQAFLVQFLRDFMAYARHCPSPVTKLIRRVGVSRQLINAAMERMEVEEQALGTDANAWLLYNGVNHALFNTNSGLALPARFALDERVFHAVASSYVL